jgi:phosphoglycolate phosphatase-like HAD superfamily hydrolase
MSTLVPSPAGGKAFVRPGFRWDAADGYLFDIDGTLLNSRDAVHYFAFQSAVRAVLKLETSIEGVHVHGNTDPGIVRAVLQRAGLANDAIDVHIPQIVAHICAEVERNQEQLRPELCPSICDLLAHLERREKLMGTASGNLEMLGWLKLEKAGIKPMFAFGSFSFPRESRADIFQHGVELARKILARKIKGRQASVTVVGDTPSDIQAARAIDVPVIALATGIFSFADLKAQDPDACFGCATDLLALSG